MTDGGEHALERNLGRGHWRRCHSYCCGAIFFDWYFERGGIFLSESARDAYFEVQKCINASLEKNQTGRVSDHDYKAIRALCSALRTELTNDLLSRREAPSVKAGADR
jgi:hypothetical protein